MLLNINNPLNHPFVCAAPGTASTSTAGQPSVDDATNATSSSAVNSTRNGSGAADAPPLVSPRKEAQLTLEQYKEIYDRLIKIFEQRPRDDWKKLIVFSKQWNQHRQGVFDRLV